MSPLRPPRRTAGLVARRSNGSSHYLIGAALSVLVVAYVLLCLDVWEFTVDDAFISYRFASNLWKQGELSFNPGERSEGFTNLLWTIMLAPFSNHHIVLA